VAKSKAPDITERPQIDLSGRAGVYYDPTGNKFDVAVGGMPFIMAITDSTPYKRQTADFRTTRVDQERDPGEHTLQGSGYWIRAQSSWHYGDGIQFTEPLEGNDNEVRFRFRDSVGIDPWTPGQVSLLKDTTKVLSLTGKSQIVTGTDTSGVTYLFAADQTATPTTSIYKITTSGTTSAFTARSAIGNGQILDICSDGTFLYVATATAIYDIGIDTGTIHQHYAINTTNASSVVLRYVKSRVIAGITRTDGSTAAYELLFQNKGSGNSVNLSTLTPINGSTVLPKYWQWTAITEARNAIYLGGYAGDNSFVFSLTVDTAGTLQTITVAATLGRGELVTALYGYLGTYIAIGTNKGVRISTVDSAGGLAYGPLTIKSSTPCWDFNARDSYIWAAQTNALGSQSGTIRINLSQPLTLSGFASPVYTGLYAKANDLAVNDASTGTVWTIKSFDNRIAFTVDGSGVWLEHPTQLTDNGYWRTGRIRYGTLENKSWKKLRVRTPGDAMHGSIDVFKVNEGGADEAIFSVQEYSTTFDFDITAAYSDITADASFKFVLNRDTTDATTGSVINGIAVKALPTPTRARVMQIPIFCFDRETDKLGNIIGYEGYARDRLANLEQMESLGKTVIIQDFTAGGTPTEVIIEQVTFSRSTPSARNYSGFGGVISVTARTLA
jgi:hypothetical protein